MTPQDYARLAQRAYLVQPQIGAESSAARAIVEGDAVAFPGSNNVACWLADLDADVVQVDGFGALHHGFWKAFNTISAKLMALPAPAVTVGHSEGAALAILFAAPGRDGGAQRGGGAGYPVRCPTLHRWAAAERGVRL